MQSVYLPSSPLAEIFSVLEKILMSTLKNFNSGFDESAKPREDIPSHAIFLPNHQRLQQVANTNVIIPTAASTCIDYEAELTIVIGKGGKGISEADALKHVWATRQQLTDVTARDWQQRHKQWFLGKSFDTLLPNGPLGSNCR
jgi:2-keto-4-pentenoate hydratase/2-oxohepta-3-ene-1,7-dioic acid hydratase in catechol pathway